MAETAATEPGLAPAMSPEPVLSRHSYEASIFLVPLDGRARTALAGTVLGSPASEHLSGITVAPPGLPGWDDGQLAKAADEADMVITLSYDLGQVDAGVVARLDRAAHDAGAALGSVIIAPDRRWTEPDAQRGAVAIREASDTVVVLGDLAPAIAFLQVLRGGSRVSASKAGV
ncbi:MAG TPA: hypothetical protein VGG75_17565 [Trebonia sp.]